MAKRERAPKPKPPKRREGRPDKPLCEDPQRYLLALLHAWIERAAKVGVSANRVAETLMGRVYGMPLLTGYVIDASGQRITPRDNIKRLIDGRPFLVQLDTVKQRPRGRAFALGDHVPYHKRNYKEKNVFRPLADDWLRKLRKILTSRPKDREWLTAMGTATGICHARETVFRELARMEASKAGEMEFFRRTLEPILDGAAPPFEWITRELRGKIEKK
jgi:hypothetical protein